MSKWDGKGSLSDYYRRKAVFQAKLALALALVGIAFAILSLILSLMGW